MCFLHDQNWPEQKNHGREDAPIYIYIYIYYVHVAHTHTQGEVFRRHKECVRTADRTDDSSNSSQVLSSVLSLGVSWCLLFPFVHSCSSGGQMVRGRIARCWMFLCLALQWIYICNYANRNVTDVNRFYMLYMMFFYLSGGCSTFPTRQAGRLLAGHGSDGTARGSGPWGTVFDPGNILASNWSKHICLSL